MTAVPFIPSPRGCPEGEALSRRGFLKASAVLGAAVAGSAVSTRYAYAEDGASTGTLVVLSLRGGFDGLSAFPAVGDPAYYAARPGIAVPASVAIPLDRTFGMHPALAALQPLWATGKMAVVHAVGTPDASRSHFRAQEVLENAAPGSSIRTGWLDRVLSLDNLPGAYTGAQFGSTALPHSMIGPSRKMAMRRVDGVKLESASWVGPRLQQALVALHDGAPAHLAAAADTAVSALDTAVRVQKDLPVAGVTAAYPSGNFGEALRDVARLIKAGVGLRVAALDLGDWDMHSDLGNVDNGWMGRKLKELAAGLAAFAEDLGPLFDTTNVVTLSEFGRRVAQNDSGGVDHGHGNAVMVLGGGLAGGKVHGKWDGLAAPVLDRGDLPGLTDYRDVLGELLRKRLGVGDLARIFPGHNSLRVGAASLH